MISYDDFLKVDIRVGKIISVDSYPTARKPTYIIKVDFGPEIGIKKSCSQLTQNYQPEDLVNTQIIAVINFEPKQIGQVMSEVLILGLADEEDKVVLLRPDTQVPLGGRMY